MSEVDRSGKKHITLPTIDPDLSAHMPKGTDPLKEGATRFEYPAIRAGGSAHVDVWYHPQLGLPGKQAAQILSKACEIHYTKIANFFRAIEQPKTNLILVPFSPGNTGGGGGYHYEGLWNEIYTDVQKMQGTVRLKWDFCSAVFAAELVELFAYDTPWDSKWTIGESLSRFLANAVVPKTLDNYETVPVWRNNGSLDYINKTLRTQDLRTGHPYDINAVGCGVCFLAYCRTVRQIKPEKIVAAGKRISVNAPTLQQVWTKLGGRSNAYTTMLAALDARPNGKPPIPWGIANDDLFD